MIWSQDGALLKTERVVVVWKKEAGYTPVVIRSPREADEGARYVVRRRPQ